MRPNGFMQNFTAYYAQAVVTTGKIQGYAGTEQVSVIDVRDIADVAAATLEGAASDGAVLDLTRPLPYALAEQCAMLSTRLGRRRPRVPPRVVGGVGGPVPPGPRRAPGPRRPGRPHRAVRAPHALRRRPDRARWRRRPSRRMRCCRAGQRSIRRSHRARWRRSRR